MKTVVSLQDLLELEIRPDGLAQQYYERLALDVVELWKGDLRVVPCPGCGATSSAVAFRRYGAEYRECADCGTLFVSPRPTEAAVIEFYRRGAAARFWREQMWPHTEAVRREKIIQPRAEWVLDGLAEYAAGPSIGLDMTPYGAALVEELCRDGSRRMRAGSWVADLDLPGEAGIRAQPLTLETLDDAGPVDFVTAFDIFDRAPDLPAFVDALARVLRPGGLLFLTVPNADGFDLQILWERYPTLVPPDKLNVLSIDGLQRRLAAPKWEILELSTPGVFDVEHVRRAIEAFPEMAWPRFVKKLIANRDAHQDFQEYLQRNRLASSARVMARRLS